MTQPEDYAALAQEVRRKQATERNPMTTETHGKRGHFLPPSDPAVCIAEAAKEAIDMALDAPNAWQRDRQILRAIQQLCYLRG
jgi:hypothetical protein